MERHKLIIHLFIAMLCASCVLGQSENMVSSNVSFSMEPSNICLYIYSTAVPPPIFYCKVEGLREGMEVTWLRNDVMIEPAEFEFGDFALTGNQTLGIYDLKIQRKITRNDDRSRYSCAVYLVTNSSDVSEWRLLKESEAAKLRVHFYVPAPRYPECSIRVPELLLSSSSMVDTTVYKEGTGFTIMCCSETVNPELKLVWFKESQNRLTELVGKNTSRRSKTDEDHICLTYDVTDHQVGDTYSCHLTIPKVQVRTSCRRESKLSNKTAWYDEQRRRCGFHDRGISLTQQVTGDHDATFTCYSKGAIEYLWQFSPALDQNKNQYHMSEDRRTVLLNLDSLDDIQYNITCTAVGESTIGSRSLIVQISKSDTTSEDIIQIVAITLGALVVLVMILLVSYGIKTRLVDQCKDRHSRGLSPQEMRARIQIRRNVAGNGGGLYTYPSRMTSSSITPLMEGPEDSGSTITEHERPPSPRPPPSGMMRPGLGRQLPVQGAVGGIILDEEEMVECEYRDESEEEEEVDPKSMNVEGLQYADLEFSEDEDFPQGLDDQDDSESSEESKKNGAPVIKPKIDYANIVHFDPRRNSDPRRDSEVRQNTESRWNSADPWRKNTNV